MSKPYRVYMINRMAIKIISYVGGNSARIRYVETGQEATVNRSIIKSFIPKKKDGKTSNK